jgi:type II secretion system protein H
MRGIIMYQRKKIRAVRVRNTSSGFTIIEILIVVVILAIAAMIAVPLASSAAGTQVRSAANMVAADLEYAKSMAISRGQSFSVVFDEASDSYRIENQDGDIIPHPVKKGFDYVVDFRSDGRLDKVDIADADFNSSSKVAFDCLGSPDNGGMITLQGGAMTIRVAVEPVTGFVTIQD